MLMTFISNIVLWLKIKNCVDILDRSTVITSSSRGGNSFKLNKFIGMGGIFLNIIIKSQVNTYLKILSMFYSIYYILSVKFNLYLHLDIILL